MGPILVTGAAGFIGFHVSRKLLQAGKQVVGFDNMNAYYSPALKTARLDLLRNEPGFEFVEADVADDAALKAVFEKYKPEYVLHLAAQAGVRYSIENPAAYVQANLVGFGNMLECCRRNDVKHLVYASSSSVYGKNKKVPFSTDDRTDQPVSFYAATKRANELMAYAYSDLFQLPTTGLRFFTVYGPWGRPDMAIFSFTQDILSGKPIKIFNNGIMKRDFTYIDDIVEGVINTMNVNPREDEQAKAEGEGSTPARIYNIGNNSPVPLMELVQTLEAVLGKEAEKIYLPMQAGDVYETYADIDSLQRVTGFRPSTPLRFGLEKFVEWYLDYYQVAKPTA